MIRAQLLLPFRSRSNLSAAHKMEKKLFGNQTEDGVVIYYLNAFGLITPALPLGTEKMEEMMNPFWVYGF